MCLSLIHFSFLQPNLYGIDWEGPTPSNDEHAVNVDELPMLLTSDQKADLDIEIIKPLAFNNRCEHAGVLDCSLYGC